MKPAELRKELKTVTFVTLTPFDKDGNLDLEGYRENIRWICGKTKNVKLTFTPTGSNGEFASLSEEEQKAVMKACIEEVNGRHPVIPGTGRAGTKQTIEISKYAQAIGADGVQIILPYYFVPTEEGMINHYKLLSEAIDIGIVVYNNPAFSKAWIKPNVMKKIIDVCDGKICGIKENTPHLMLFDAMARAMQEKGIPIQSGFGEQWYAYQFPWGADGFVSPFGNFFPEYPIALSEATKNYDFAKIRELLKMMRPYYDFVGRVTAAHPDTGVMVKPGGSIYGEGNMRFGILKDCMNMMGLRGGYMRSPLHGCNQKEKDELKEILKGLKIL